MISFIENSAQLAALLEVSGTPKPGNVHRNQNFEDTRYEHFIVSSVSFGPKIRKAAKKGIELKEEQIGYPDANLGKLTKEAILRSQNSHSGGNTHLGTLLIFTPLALSAGLTLPQENNKIKKLKKNFDKSIKSTTPQDSIQVLKGIKKSTKPEEKDNWLGKTKKDHLSIFNEKIEEKIKKENLNLYELMKISSEYDDVAKELTGKLEKSSKIGLPSFQNNLNKHKDVNIATVNCFLEILAKNPDKFIARKEGLKKTEYLEDAISKGMDKAEETSKKAKEIIELGGIGTEKGKKMTKKLDKDLRKKNLNPGTTADLTATSIFLSLLSGTEI